MSGFFLHAGLTLDGEHTIQYTGDVLEKCTLEAYIINLGNNWLILLTKVAPINPIKSKNKKCMKRLQDI